jgi:catechol 2,3-dioxygenase-like lactoylglutathione lyase family enzyme
LSDKNFMQITPFLQVREVAATVRFFVDVLGFHAWVEGPDYAYVQREAAAVRISRASDFEASPQEKQELGPRAFFCYIDVRDLEAVVAELRPRLLTAGVRGAQGPVDQTWGQREFWVPLPEGGLLIFGQAIAAMPAIKTAGGSH